MRAKITPMVDAMRRALPYIWGFAAALALDHVIDVQILFLPVLVGLVGVMAGCRMLRSVR